MKRPQPPGSRPGRHEDDIKKAYTLAQLAEIGAVTLAWNKIEIMLDWVFAMALQVDQLLWTHLGRRISATGKLEILRTRNQYDEILDPDAIACMKVTFDAISEYKKYRDAIIHSVSFDLEKGIGQHVMYDAQLVQVLITTDALTGLYNRLTIVLEELREIDLLYRLADKAGAIAVYGHEEFDPIERRRKRDVPIQTAQCRKIQKKRLSLPPLPRFPDELQVQGETEPQELHPRS